MHRLYSIFASALVLLAVAWPATEHLKPRRDRVDSFPLSHYPMFSGRHAPVQSFIFARGVTPVGDTIPLHYSTWGSGGLNQARKQLARLALESPESAERVCRKIAERVRRRARPECRDVVQVQIVSGEFDPVEYFHGHDDPRRLRVLAKADVVRAKPVSRRAFPAWVRTVAAGHSWQPHNEARLLRRGDIEQSLALARDFLLRRQALDGRFQGEQEVGQNGASPRYRQVQQAIALWGTALIHGHSPSGPTRDAVERGLQFVLAHSVSGPAEGSLAIAYPGTTTCYTESVALAVLTIVDFLRAEGDALSPERRDALAGALAGYVRFVVAAQRGDRRFARSYSVESGKFAASASPSADGASLLCLVKAARYAGFDDLRALVESTTLALARRYTADQWAQDPDSSRTKSFFQWSCMAFEECASAGWGDSEFFQNYVLAMAWWMIHTHRTLDRTRNTGYAVVGLAAAFRVARARGDDAAAAEIEYAIDRSIHRITGFQIGGPLPTCDAAVRAAQNSRSIGGALNGRRDASPRIDVSARQAHALVLALETVYAAAERTR